MAGQKEACKKCIPSDTLCQNAPGAVATITTSDRSKPPDGFDLFVPTENTNDLDSNNMNGTSKYADLEKLSNTNSYTPKSWTPQIRNTFIAIMVTMIVLIISLHRFCPSSFKSVDLLFAGEHFIDDTVRSVVHASCIRMFDMYTLTLTLTFSFSLSSSLFSTPKECSTHDLARHSPPRCPLHSLFLGWKRLERTIYWSPRVWYPQ